MWSSTSRCIPARSFSSPRRAPASICACGRPVLRRPQRNHRYPDIAVQPYSAAIRLEPARDRVQSRSKKRPTGSRQLRRSVAPSGRRCCARQLVKTMGWERRPDTTSVGVGFTRVARLDTFNTQPPAPESDACVERWCTSRGVDRTPIRPTSFPLHPVVHAPRGTQLAPAR